MCGIAGAVGVAGSEAFAPQMADALRHRGPDGEGSWADTERSVVLVHRRLAIIDLSDAASQPMLREPGLAITYNGEIYDYIELRGTLQERGHVFRTASDTEVILAAYQEFGTACVEHMNGMFAFALWDANREILFCARDRLGEKPLLFARTAGGGFAFASEAKALAVLPGITLTADHAAVGRFLQHGELDQDDGTFFSGIRSLPAGHVLTYHLPSRSVEMRRYWEPRAAADMDAPEDQLVERLVELLTDSVRIRLRSDVEVGTSLSGGLDSSLIVGIASRIGATPRTFSARSPGWVEDEGRYMKAVRDRLGLDGHEIVPDPRAVPDEIGAVIRHQEAPIGSLSVYAQWCVMRLARDHRVTVLLDGQGADELFAGYPTFLGGHLASLLATGRVREAAAESASIVRRFGARQTATAAVRIAARRTRRRFPRLEPSIDRDWAVSTRLEMGERAERHDIASSQDRALRSSVLPSLLRYADRNSMAFGREVRLPYLDHRLVAFALGLPVSLRVNAAEQKVALRRAARSFVPDAVLERRDKVGFTVPERSWLQGPVRGWALAMLTDERTLGRPWTDRTGVSAIAASLHRNAGASSTAAWRVIATELWAREFLDREAAPATSRRTALAVGAAGPIAAT